MTCARTHLTRALTLGLLFSLTLTAFAEKRPEKKEGQSSISVMDSTEAQWGRRSINDSVYRGYTVNAVYFERGRQRLPDSFNMYKPTPIGPANVGDSKDSQTPTTIKVNGVDQDIPQD
jgi:hypothetical protein